MSYRYIDIHSHITFPDYDKDRDEVIDRMKNNSIATITVGVDLKSSKEAIAFANSNQDFFASIGIHPNNSGKEEFNSEIFRGLADNPNVVAIGECGLDYFRNNKEDTKKQQLDIFEQQIELAVSTKKPLMLHCRPSKGSMDAYDDALDIIVSKKKTHGDKLNGNFHFFVGDVDTTRKIYGIGFSTSFPGVITFTSQYNEVVRFAPLDKIHAETDAPFAAPAPNRGKRNEPSFVVCIVEKIAELRNEDISIVESALLENAKRLFGIAVN